ncbi:MAG: methylenetetrahydrofolate reductase [NAD(P)H] [Bacteroidetes bacterium]|nr:methylenetetrahydrofolate reductase [NAD(P)H] [Bacteroidota bacterium]|tara:strand:+ start:175 stop:1125 length:951 start_codon:yes stop_codon:yes gene_type:complete
MKVSELLRSGKPTLFTFELLPPLKGNTIQTIYDAIDPLLEFEPSYINVTYHQSETVYTEKKGLIEKKIVRKRPGTVAISTAIKNKYKITVVPHLICGGFTKEETEDALIELNFLGIHNILALRGDPPKGSRVFIPEENGHRYTNELIEQIMDLNKGSYLSEDLKHNYATEFSVGVAGYPEKHIEAPNMDADLQNLKRKVDAGAEYIVTQLFFDNQRFFEFVDNCRKIGIDVPIIPGIKPLSTLNDIKMLPQTFAIDLPHDLMKEASKCKTSKEVRQIGIEWCTMQSKELKAAGVPGIHYYTLSQSDNIARIASLVF